MRPRRIIAAAAAALAAGTMAVTLDAPAKAAPTPGLVYGLRADGRLVTFDRSAPGSITSLRVIRGLPRGTQVVAIDIRPATGQLFGLGDDDALYTIDRATARAALASTLSVPTPNAAISIDFNPVVDRLRVIAADGTNWRVNVSTGAVTVDTPQAYAGADPSAGVQPRTVGAAYSNNFAGTATTTLYVLDARTNNQAIQNPPNNGTLTTTGDTGVTLNDRTGFDVSLDGQALVSVNTTAGGSVLYTATPGELEAAAPLVPVGRIGREGQPPVVDIAADTGPPDNVFGLTPDGRLASIPRKAPGSASIVGAITGLAEGDSLVAIDRRPSNSTVYGLSAQNRIYTINTATAVATPVGANPFGTYGLSPAGFDVNPVPDRLRIVDPADDNLRVHPDTGALVLADTPLTYDPADVRGGLSPTVAGVAYTPAISGATVIYYIDSRFDALATSASPNGGVLATVGTGLGFGVNTQLGFDIDGTLSRALAAGNVVGFGNALLSIDLPSGKATMVGVIPFAVVGLAF